MLDYCIKEASWIPYTKGQERIYAVITDRRGKVLSEGANSYTESSQTQRFYAKVVGLAEKVFNHAEISALKKLKPHHKPYSIYIARVNREGEPLLAAPCPICSTALDNFDISRIEYTVALRERTIEYRERL
jgi:tRNA(Arg) A34 adenosine deaminase TadA